MLKNILTNDWFLTAIAVPLTLLLLGRFINDKKLAAWGAAHKAFFDKIGLSLGQRLSSIGRSYLGIKASEKAEAKFQSWGGVYFNHLMPNGQLPFGPAFVKGLDSDDKLTQKEKIVKKILSLLFAIGLLMALASSARAEKSVDLGGVVEVLFPTQWKDLTVGPLYDVLNKQALLGGEFSLLRRKNLEAGLGLATEANVWDDGAKGIVYGSVTAYNREKTLFFGLWGGRDFRNSIYRAGARVGLPLGGQRD